MNDVQFIVTVANVTGRNKANLGCNLLLVCEKELWDDGQYDANFYGCWEHSRCLFLNKKEI